MLGNSDQSQQQKTYAGTFIVRNAKGLHTRPSTELVKCAILYNSDITLKCNDLKVSAKSLLGILTLAAAEGTLVEVRATGEDAKEAVEALIQLAAKHFNLSF